VAIACSQTSNDQILVVIGGDSVFNGCGQPEQKLWTKRLQTILGPRYAVVNFAFRGGSPDTGAIVAATILAKKHKRLLYVASTWPEYYAYPKFSNFEYLYWDAFYKHILDRNSAWEQFERSRVEHSKGKEKSVREEVKLQNSLDSIFYFDDLWTTIGYQKFFTVWNSFTREGFTKPRRKLPDPDTDPPPVESRFPLRPEEIHYVKHAALRFVETEEHGRWRSKAGAWNYFDQVIRTPSTDMRARSLIVLMRVCPLYLSKLTEKERQADEFTYDLCAQKWCSAGYHSTVVGSNFVPADYFDPRHLAAAGGDKLAPIMADQIEALAQELGYTK
jgi:hypothetical protein